MTFQFHKVRLKGKGLRKKHKGYEVSIPQGTIKRTCCGFLFVSIYLFQFHKVRLKEIYISCFHFFALFQFHKVRLKAG